MKKLIATCVMLTAASMVSFAQSKQTSHNMSFDAQPTKSVAAPSVAQTAKSGKPTAAQNQAAEKRAEANKKAYNLTDVQYKAALQAEKEYEMELAQIRAGGEPGEGQLMQLGMTRDRKIKEVMTPEQIAKFDANQNASRH